MLWFVMFLLVIRQEAMDFIMVPVVFWTIRICLVVYLSPVGAGKSPSR